VILVGATMLSGMKAADTHALLKTVACEHLDVLVYWATGEFPDSGLLLAQCTDGRWFIEVEYGQAFDGTAGLSFPFVLPYVFPTFFSTEDDARHWALQCLYPLYPKLEGRDLSLYYAAR
jgi:hypothetical protein